MGYDLRFVHLGITIEHLQNHITIFGFSIAFYGIIIGIGMLLGIVCGVIGARLYYVFFRWDNYRGNLLEILNLRAGGLAIYGGVIGGILSLMFYCKRKKQNFLNLADSSILGVLVGQILGRWGNFFNAEAFGRYTDSLFAMQLRRDIVNPIMIDSALLQHLVRVNGVDYIQVHPTFLYESVWNLCLLLFLLWYRPKKRFTGEMFFLYLGGYGLGRVWIEGLRTDSLLLPGTGIAVSQALAGVCVLVALLCILAGRRLAARGRKN